jgi:hypothetical protein
MGLQRRIRAEINFRTKHGNYYASQREFNSQDHLNKWLDWMHRNSEHKVIGVKTI